MAPKKPVRTDAYEKPALITLGSLYELTLGCNKTFGASDGFTFGPQADPIVCTSAG